MMMSFGWGRPRAGYATLSLVTFQLCLLLGLSSCQKRLPKYAEPQGRVVEPDSLTGRDLISYRVLSSDDFLAKSPPTEMLPYAKRMGAVTCANVLTHPEPEYYVSRIEPAPGERAAVVFEGAYLRLSFAARMDRNCSWWNPQGGPIPHDYVLQHEQIHFALAEIAARQLNREAAKLVEQPIVRDTEAEVHEYLHGIVEKMVDRAISELVRRNRKFDQATSNTFAPQVQQKWFDEVMSELSRTPP